MMRLRVAHIPTLRAPESASPEQIQKPLEGTRRPERLRKGDDFCMRQLPTWMPLMPCRVVCFPGRPLDRLPTLSAKSSKNATGRGLPASEECQRLSHRQAA